MIKIFEYGKITENEIFRRASSAPDVSAPVREIIAAVREGGDRAVLAYCEKFDKVRLDSLEVSEAEFARAEEACGEEFLRVLEKAAKNIEEYHARQKREGFVIDRGDGSYIGQKVTPLARVGLYVPGGTAAYPSTVLMDVIPAKTAGVKDICIATPPGRDGNVPAAILAAAKLAGVSRVYKMGGAQAIAALAYGTESVKKVDKIVGPGNAFVAEAKRQVFGEVAIDMIAGPSEILVIADGNSDPAFVAADLLSQAEHDKNASAVLVTESASLAGAVKDEIEKQIEVLPRREIARVSVDSRGMIIVVPDIKTAVEVSNRLAPEHLELCTDEPEKLLPLVENAGSVFMGRYCPEALGDYLAGPNHTLPTGGTARFSSPLSVDDFIKKTQFTYYSQKSFGEVYRDIALFAEREGLSAHAKSALIRFGE
ncbi:MAG: histidinol dehydrogenase [Clostridia bacterium]|nr:histidinol dehydrogenase [Clostridia bacterium]